MQINNTNGFNQNLVKKYLELEKNFLLLKNRLQDKKQSNSNYKTELCKKFQAKGYCPYGKKCRFAHGKRELVSKTQGVNYKKERCKSFYEKGYCPYGYRCQFQHDERKLRDISISFFYFQLFLYKYFGFRKYNRFFFEKKSSLYKRRLPIFESLTHNVKKTKNIFSQPENEKWIFCYNFNEGDSLCSKSGKSNDNTTSDNNNSYNNDNNFLLKEIYDNINN